LFNAWGSRFRWARLAGKQLWSPDRGASSPRWTLLVRRLLKEALRFLGRICFLFGLSSTGINRFFIQVIEQMGYPGR